MNRFSVTRQALFPAISALFLFASSFAVVGATTNVSFGAFFFNPKIVTISEGDTVAWTLQAGQIADHTVTGTGTDPICGAGIIGNGCQHTFPTAGSFRYICATFGHAGAGMTGLVQVVRTTPPTPALLTNLMRLPNGQFRFTVNTTANRTNVVQASTNPVPSNWVPIGTNVPANNSFIFTDTNAPGLRLRFYRVVEP